MSEPKPYYKVEEPDADWSEAAAARFDGALPPLNPQQPTPEGEPIWEESMQKLRELVQAGREAVEFATDIRIANAARQAMPEIEAVFRNWMFPVISELPNLHRLHELLVSSEPNGEDE